MDNVAQLHMIKGYVTNHTMNFAVPRLFSFMLNHWDSVGKSLQKKTVRNSHEILIYPIRSDLKFYSKNALSDALKKSMKKYHIIRATKRKPMRWYGCRTNAELYNALKGSIAPYYLVTTHGRYITNVQGVYPKAFKIACHQIAFNFTKQTKAENLIIANYEAVSQRKFSTQRSLHNVLKYALPTSKFGRYLLSNIASVNKNHQIALCIKPKQTYLHELNTKVYLAQYSQHDLAIYKALLLHHRRIRYFGAMSDTGLPHVLSRTDAIRFLRALLYQVRDA